MDFSRAQGTRQLSRFPCHMNIRGRLGRRYHLEWVIMRVIVLGMEQMVKDVGEITSQSRWRRRAISKASFRLVTCSLR